MTSSTAPVYTLSTVVSEDPSSAEDALIEALAANGLTATRGAMRPTVDGHYRIALRVTGWAAPVDLRHIAERTLPYLFTTRRVAN